MKIELHSVVTAGYPFTNYWNDYLDWIGPSVNERVHLISVILDIKYIFIFLKYTNFYF
jgi:hypothetical protein